MRPRIVKPASSLAGQIAHELAYAFMVKKNWDSANSHVKSNAIAKRERIWIIDFKAVAVYHRDSEWSEWRAVLERSERTFKCMGFHGMPPVKR